ncbi:hypothetical protein HETIRDRAFT_108395 [Heterobasidion irregulare TC 32-1]|uniref:Uncharacterized protein n=1 Tax=Heterobasidion irregulare (strain TC 32-1) TaxID=747525 RepID=W4JPW7_HETIT|nr:uncharacterized protein HETIRDRAFT_108395 [Heterobasidion irregulare TC 32-1]ETW74921.1 hypothetical protein HETIRDRAFT_108395 [Heterobasidion irregulare TC 32-1]
MKNSFESSLLTFITEHRAYLPLVLSYRLGSEPVQSQPRCRPALAERTVYETAEIHFFGLRSRHSTDERSPPAVPVGLVAEKPGSRVKLGCARPASGAALVGDWRSLANFTLVHAAVPPRCAGTSPRAGRICCVEDRPRVAAAPLTRASRTLSRDVSYYTSHPGAASTHVHLSVLPPRGSTRIRTRTLRIKQPRPFSERHNATEPSTRSSSRPVSAPPTNRTTTEQGDAFRDSRPRALQTNRQTDSPRPPPQFRTAQSARPDERHLPPTALPSAPPRAPANDQP